MSWDDPIRVGLPELPAAESLVEIINGCPNLNRMRKAILEGRRDSPLIHSALMAAEYNGFSGEDTYTYLAYHALVMAETQHKKLCKLLNVLPMTSWIIPHGGDPIDLSSLAPKPVAP